MYIGSAADKILIPTGRTSTRTVFTPATGKDPIVVPCKVPPSNTVPPLTVKDPAVAVPAVKVVKLPISLVTYPIPPKTDVRVVKLEQVILLNPDRSYCGKSAIGTSVAVTL